MMLSEVTLMLQDYLNDLHKIIGACFLCYSTYRILKYIYIKKNINELRKRNKIVLHSKTTKIKRLIDFCGKSKEELSCVSQLPWNDLISQLKYGNIIQL